MVESHADEDYVKYLESHKYHPRSSVHGDALLRLVLRDLIRLCEPIRRNATEGRLVYKLNHTVNPDSLEQWNIDLVVGTPTTSGQEVFASEDTMPFGEPRDIRIAIDAKSVMTEHGKARRNRQRDLNSLHEILHRSDPRAIVGGVLTVNLASRFLSPLREDITIHRHVRRLVKETVEIMSNIPRSPSPSGGFGLDAFGVIVVDHTNINGDKSKLVISSPAPGLDSPLHYRRFLRDICEAYSVRFCP
jgi:hypothetical protein